MMTSSRRFALRCVLVSSALALVWTAAACEPKQAPATKPAAENGAAAAKPADKGGDKAAAAAKPADGKGGDAAKPADGKADPAKSADGKGGAAPTLPLGQNDPSFFEGIEGEGQLWTTIETSMGTFNCKLHEKQTPNTVANFVGLARGKKAFVDPATKQPTLRPFYDGIAFHRVIPKFMVQIGDPTGTGRYNPGYRFKDEINPDLKHTKGGILSMANAGPGTNGSQFFITEKATPHLDGRHTVFGECNEVDLVREIAAVPTGPGNKPLQPIKIVKVKFMRKAG